MPTRTEQNIFTVIFPFYVTAKSFGMFPASFTGDPRQGIFTVKWYDKILSLTALGIMVCVTFVQILNPIKSFNKSVLVINGWQIRWARNYSKFIRLRIFGGQREWEVRFTITI